MTSTLDLIGPGFTLLTATDSPSWRRQAETAQRAGLPLTHRTINTDTQSEAVPGRWERLVGTARASVAVLARPDGHVAWRGTGPAAELQPVLRRILSAP